ncbi:unnamed protein product [Rotaria sp. Silwood1]|nr:unnamed protein product [Rotaria sp. Silwood1]
MIRYFFQSVKLCGNNSNKIFEISQVSYQLLVAQSVIIAGRRCQVKRIMAYKTSWMYDYYINLIKRLAPQFKTNTSQTLFCVIS